MDAIKKIGVFGLSADPPHRGHAHIVSLALNPEFGRMDVVHVVPTFKHADKEYENSAELRLEMCNAMFDKMKCVVVDNIAITKKLSGRHWDLMEAIDQKYAVDKMLNEIPYELHIIVGGDVAMDILNGLWYRGDELMEKYCLIILRRDDCPSSSLFDLKHNVIGFDYFESSSYLRQKMMNESYRASKMSFEAMLSPEVLKIVQERNLYNYANRI